MSLTKTTYSMLQGGALNVLDYMSAAQIADVLSPTGGTIDVTSAVQAAIDASYDSNNGSNNSVVFPAGRYLITAQLNLHPGTKLQGVNIDAGGISGGQSFQNQISDSKGTVILFNPSTQQSLFKPVLPKGGSVAWGGIGIDGFNIWGNTSKTDYHRTVFGDVGPVVETSLYAFDFDDVQMSSVRNIGVMGFMSAIREANRCQNNSYQNIYIQYCRDAAIVYTPSTTGVEVTDSLYFNVRVWTCLHGVKMVNNVGTVDPLHVRFNSCFFGGFASTAFIITSGAREVMFFDCYCEGVGLDTSLSGTACFLVSGPSPEQNLVNLNIIGGNYAGATGVIAPVNSYFLNTETCGGINVIGVAIKRFITGIACTAATRNRSIYLANPYFQSVTGALFDASTVGKIIGTYRTIRSDGGNNIVVVSTEFLTWSGDLQITAPTIRFGDGSSSSARPGGDNTMSCGRADARWSVVYAATGTINTSDEREKRDIRAIEAIEKRVAVKCKGLLKAFRWKNAVAEKGPNARVHFGAIAQEIKAVFEAEGLNADDYGVFCYDEWEDTFDEEGTLIIQGGNRYGLRYEELLSFILASL